MRVRQAERPAPATAATSYCEEQNICQGTIASAGHVLSSRQILIGSIRGLYRNASVQLRTFVGPTWANANEILFKQLCDLSLWIARSVQSNRAPANSHRDQLLIRCNIALLSLLHRISRGLAHYLLLSRHTLAAGCSDIRGEPAHNHNSAQFTGVSMSLAPTLARDQMERLRRIGARKGVIQIVPPRTDVRPAYIREDEDLDHELLTRPLASPTGPGGAAGFSNRHQSQIAVPEVHNIYMGTFWGDQAFSASFKSATSI